MRPGVFPLPLLQARFQNPDSLVFRREAHCPKLGAMGSVRENLSSADNRPGSAENSIGRRLRRALRIFNWLHSSGAKSKGRKTDARDGAISAVRVLAVTENDRFYTTLTEIGAGCGWQVRRARSLSEAVAAIDSHATPLVILDWDENNADWRRALERLCARPHHPCVLLASRVVDENLRQEVLRYRGYDVLPRSTDRDQMIRAIEFAWFWTTRSCLFMDAAKEETRS